KRQALDDLQHEGRKAVIVGGQSFSNLVYNWSVVALKAAAQGVGQQFLGQAFGETVAVGAQDGFQLARPFERATIGERARRINRKLTVTHAPRADGVKVFQPEAQRIHARVTRRAGGIGAVLL